MFRKLDSSGTGSDFIAVKSSLPLASDDSDSELGSVCSRDIDTSEPLLALADNRDEDIRDSKPGFITLAVDIRESVLASDDASLEVDADDKRLLEDAAVEMRTALVLRLRRADDAVRAFPEVATSAVFASSMSRSLSSLRWLIIWCRMSGWFQIYKRNITNRIRH